MDRFECHPRVSRSHPDYSIGYPSRYVGVSHAVPATARTERGNVRKIICYAITTTRRYGLEPRHGRFRLTIPQLRQSRGARKLVKLESESRTQSILTCRK